MFAVFCRTRLPKARLPRITKVLPNRTCRAVSCAVYAPVKPVQKMDAPAISQIEQRLAAQHSQQTPLLPIQHTGSRLILDKNLVLLDDLHSSATVTTHESGGTVISLEVYNGAVASHDFALGTVSLAECNSLRATLQQSFCLGCLCLLCLILVICTT